MEPFPSMNCYFPPLEFVTHCFWSLCLLESVDKLFFFFPPLKSSKRIFHVSPPRGERLAGR